MKNTERQKSLEKKFGMTGDDRESPHCFLCGSQFVGGCMVAQGIKVGKDNPCATAYNRMARRGK